MAPLELTVHEDPVTGVWTFEFHGHAIEVEPTHGFVKIDGRLHQTNAVQGLADVHDLAGTPLAAITRLIEPPASTPLPAPLDPQPAQPARVPARAPDPVAPSSPVAAATPPPQTAPRRTTREPSAPAEPRMLQQSAARPEPVLNTVAAAEYLGLSPKTLETKRCRGDGPPFVKLGRRVVYRHADLKEWLAERRRTSTSDTGERSAE